MPFNPRQKSRSTTQLPAALREELGIPSASTDKSHFRPGHNQKADKRHQYNARTGNGQPYTLKVIGRPQSAVNGAQKGTKQTPIKSLRNQEKEQAASSSHAPPQHKPRHVVPQDSGSRSEPVVSRRSMKRKMQQDVGGSDPKKSMRVNPFTGEMQAENSVKKVSSKKKNTTALERMMQKAERSEAGGSRADTARKSRKHMSQQEKEEEDEIRWLEYHLRKGQSGADGEEAVRDDLDDFLQDLDRFQVGMYETKDTASYGSASGSDSETASDSDSEDVGDESASESPDDISDQDSLSDSDDVSMQSFDSNDENDFSNWDAAMASTDEDDEAEESVTSTQDDSEADEAMALIEGSSVPATSSQSVESAASTELTGKYIPPAMRAKAGSAPTDDHDDLAAQKLRRQAQGLLNKLGDGNIDSIVFEIEALYRSYARARVTSTITQLVLDTVTSRSNLVDTFVILHGAFVAALHKVVGVEFAAFFVQRMVEELLRHYEALTTVMNDDANPDDDARGKECLNLTVLACELYNLQVLACPLIYDLIRLFLGQAPGASTAPSAKSVSETDVELILKTIRSCGPQLRHDDPSALKAIIALTSSRLSSTSVRSKFMLERMEELLKASGASRSKSGNHDANDPSSPAGQLLARMKKYLGGMSKKRSVRSYEPLRIGLKDLQDAEKKGKWWLVGAAWTGQTDQTDAHGLTKLTPMNAQKVTAHPAPDDGDAQQQKLLTLARSQGMNTDARRAVFITLMTSEDYKQATETLLQLKLNEVQRRETIRVLVHCCGSEAVFNPYYTLIGQELCKHNHGMRVTLQYCLWDFLRELGAKEVGGEKFSASLLDVVDDANDGDDGPSVDPRRISNLARCFGWWLTHDCLSLQSLKVVDFTALRSRPVHFLGLTLVFAMLSIQCSGSSGSGGSPARVLSLHALTQSPLRTDKIAQFAHAGLTGGNPDLPRGLLLFLNTHLTPKYQRKLIFGHDKTAAAKNEAKDILVIIRDAIAAFTNTTQSIVHNTPAQADHESDTDNADDAESV